VPDLGTFKPQMATFQTEIAKEFGSVRVQLVSNKLWMLVIGWLRPSQWSQPQSRWCVCWSS